MKMLLILSLCTIVTSMISGVVGMAGGVLLLSIMTFFVEYKMLIPLHGVVQLVSNFSRTMYLRKNIRMDFLTPFILGAPFGFLIAFYILKEVSNTNYYYLLLSFFILYAVFKPKNLPEFKLAGYQWGVLGLFAGIQGALIGVTGPLLSPFYLRSDLKKEEIVATKAAQQIITHLFKIPLFLSLEFNYTEHFDLIIIMSLAAVFGTYLGVKLLGKVNESLFKILFKSFLLIAALRLMYKFWVSI
jgi:uncharacterized membrane protein YfcA